MTTAAEDCVGWWRFLAVLRTALLSGVLLSLVACSNKQQTAAAADAAVVTATTAPTAMRRGDEDAPVAAVAVAAPAPAPFHDVESAWIDSAGAIFVVDSLRVYQFKGDSAAASTSRVGYNAVVRRADAIALLGDSSVKHIAAASDFRSISVCSFDGGTLVARNDDFILLKKEKEAAVTAYSLLNARSCSKRDVSAIGVKINASAIGGMGADTTLISANGSRIGVMDGFCNAVDVYDVASQHKVSTDANSKSARSAKGCDAISLGNDGVVKWSPRGRCALGAPMAFLDSGSSGSTDAVIGNTPHLVIERGYQRDAFCGTGNLADEKKPAINVGAIDLPLPANEQFVHVAATGSDGSGARHVVVTTQSRVFDVKLQPTLAGSKSPSRFVATPRELTP